MFFTRMRFFRFAGLVLLFVVSAQVTTQAEETLKVGAEAPKFVLKQLDSEDFFLSDVCGKLRKPWKNKIKHVVVLSFFATWCKPCMEELPEIEKIFEKYQKENVKLFLVNVREDKEKVAKFVSDKKIVIPILLDQYGKVSEKYEALSIPKLVVINPEGQIAYIGNGFDKALFENLSRIIDGLK